MASVTLSQIGKRFAGTVAIDDVSLEIAEGEFLTLLGPSGCGKSTLLRIIAGLEPQSAGSVAIAGAPVDRLRPKQRDVAMVFQSYALYPHMTVAENIATPLRMRRMTRWQRLPLVGRLLPGAKAARAGIAASVAEVAAALEIGALLGRKPAQLSGGQRQRVAVGRAMVRQPQVFLMDEPLSNLDAKLRVQMRAEIKELHRRLGITFIYVTHDQAEAMTMSDRVAVMMHGRLLQVAPPRTIYAEPADLEVAAFIGSPRINLLPGRVRADGAIDVPTATLGLGHPLPAGSGVTVGLRPEGLDVVAAGPGTLAGMVGVVEHLGADLFVHVHLPGAAEPLIVRADPARHEALAYGDAVAVAPRPQAVLLFGADGRRVSLADAASPRLRSRGSVDGYAAAVPAGTAAVR